MDSNEAREVLAAIAAPIPGDYIGALEKRNKRTGEVTSYPFIRWNLAAELMDQRAPGWCSEIRAVHGESATAAVTVRVTIPLPSGGQIYREATGTDDEPETGFGEPLDRAEAAALKRAFAKLGLGRRELYKGADGRHAPPGGADRPAAAARGPKSSRDVPPTSEELDAVSKMRLDELRLAYKAAHGAGRTTFAAIIRGAAEALDPSVERE